MRAAALVVFAFLTFCLNAEIQLGIQGSFLSISDYSDVTRGEGDFRLGYNGGVFGHYTFPLWMPNALGIGPYFEFGKAGDGTIGNTQVTTTSLWRTGLEAKTAFSINKVWQFYARLGIGYERHNNQLRYVSNGTTVTYDGPTTGISGSGALGLQFLLNKGIALFSEASVVSGNMTEKSSNSSQAGLTSRKRTFIAYRLSLGLFFRLL